MEINDWVRKGKTMIFWQYPPKFPSDEEIETFADGLKETIPEKLNVLYERKDYLTDRCKKLFSTANNLRGKKKIYYRSWAITEYEEVLVIDKWLLYWVTINSKLNRKKIIEPNYKFTQAEIERAKQNTYEWNFPGNLDNRSKKRKVGLCPFHEEKTPSFVIYLETNSAHCFGCLWSGDVIAFYQKLHNVSFVEAVRRLL